MKKLLLGSTALVVGGVMAAPAMAADPIKMGIGGYYTFYALAGNIDSTYAFNGSFTNYKGLPSRRKVKSTSSARPSWTTARRSV